MSRQCSECKTVSIVPLNKLYYPLEFIPPQYRCFKCGKVFTEEEYKELDEGEYISKIPVVECDIEC